jgi:hypothetical protein
VGHSDIGTERYRPFTARCGFFELAELTVDVAQCNPCFGIRWLDGANAREKRFCFRELIIAQTGVALRFEGAKAIFVVSHHTTLFVAFAGIYFTR